MSLVRENARHRWSAICDLTFPDVVPYEEMSISLGAAAVGALAALVFAGLLARRCIRAPRLATVALLLAVAALTMALGAQAVGYYHGFGESTFRAVQIGAQLVAPLALTWALAELTGKSMGARFASRELRLRGDLRRRRGARLVRGRAGQRGTAGIAALWRVRLG